MYKRQKILAIIPARGGSKGLPGKNIKMLNGQPLIAWSIEQAKNSKYIDEIFVSTDSQEIADVAERFGIKVPELRPGELAQDSSPSCEAVLHAVELFEKKDKYFDYLMLIEPTSPLRAKNDLDNAIKTLLNTNNSSLVSVGEVHTEHPMIIKKVFRGQVKPYIENSKKIYQRQQTDKAYFPYGVAYICKVETYKNKKTFYLDDTLPYFIERWQNYEIDDAIDLCIIDAIIKMRKE